MKCFSYSEGRHNTESYECHLEGKKNTSSPGISSMAVDRQQAHVHDNSKICLERGQMANYRLLNPCTKRIYLTTGHFYLISKIKLIYI